MPLDTLIKARSLSRRYGPLSAVDGISFELKRGEILGFLGPNGAGKSTTLQMVCGCLAPSAGSVEIAGVDLQRQPLQAKRQIGYLPEVPPLYPDLTVVEYLRFCARLHGLTAQAAETAVARVIEQCALGELRKRLIGHLSKGMQQRVGIAQALVHKPAAIVLDEPTSGLDPIQIHQIRQLIRGLRDEHAVLMSSHILPEVEAVCSRVLILHQGRLLYDARIDAATGEPWLRLGLHHDPGNAAILAVDGVLETRAGEGAEYLLRVRREPELPERLLRIAVERGWRPYLLSPQRSDLEQEFLKLTTSEGQPA